MIIDRLPDYGDGRKDGCVIMSEMHVDLYTKKTNISGQVSDVNTRIPLNAASIKLLTKDGQELLLQTNSEGKFAITPDNNIYRLEVTYVGYRRFIAEL